MAGSASYTAILDANVLYPQLIRDTLLSLAVEGLYHARWSASIHAEWTRNLLKSKPELIGKLDLLVERMNASVLQPYGIEVQHPDEFLMNQLQLQEIPALRAIKKMRARWTNPVRPAQELIAAFEKRGLPMTADLLREAVTLI